MRTLAEPAATVTSGLQRLSIRARLLVLVLAILLPAVGFFLWFLDHASDKAREAAYIEVKLVADNLASGLAQSLQGNKDVLQFVATEFRGNSSLAAPNFDPAQLMRMHPELVNIGVRDLQANNLYSYLPHPTPAADAIRFPWVQAGLNSEAVVVGNAFRGPLSGRWVTVLTQPVRGEDGRRHGLAYLSLDLLTLNQRTFQAMPAGVLATVLDPDFRILLRSAEPEQWMGTRLAPALAAIYGDRSEGYQRAPDIAGIPHLWAFVSVPGSGWRVSVGMAEDAVLGPARALIYRGGALGGVLLLLLLGLAWRIAAGISGPVVALEQAAAAIAGGDREVRASGDGPREVAAVAQQFNLMLDTLDRQRVEREALSSHYGTLLKSARDIVLLMDREGRIIEANDAALVAYGYTAEELRAMDVFQLRTAQAQATIAKDYRDAFGPQGVLFETEHRRKDGSSFPVEVSSRAIEIEGRVYRQNFIRDISVRRAAETALRQQLDELRRWQRAMLNREQRVLELKQEVNQLLAQGGQPPRYASALEHAAGPAEPGDRQAAVPGSD